MIISSQATFRKNYSEKQAGDFQVNLHVPVKFPLSWSKFCATCCAILKKKGVLKNIVFERLTVHLRMQGKLA